jgi:hypothetical protein
LRLQLLEPSFTDLASVSYTNPSKRKELHTAANSSSAIFG